MASVTTTSFAPILAPLVARRSVYALGKREIVPDADVVALVKDIVRNSPSSFNSQTSRVVFLFGSEHDRYWNQTVHSAVQAVSPVDKFPAAESRLRGFVGARFTILFFESQATVASYQANVPAYADRFPEWSTHGSGMAQVNTWNALAQLGYGVNLQHYGNLTGDEVKRVHGLPGDWVPQAEMVVGSKEGEPKEKTFMPDQDRFVVKGL